MIPPVGVEAIAVLLPGWFLDLRGLFCFSLPALRNCMSWGRLFKKPPMPIPPTEPVGEGGPPIPEPMTFDNVLTSIAIVAGSTVHIS